MKARADENSIISEISTQLAEDCFIIPPEGKRIHPETEHALFLVCAFRTDDFLAFTLTILPKMTSVKQSLDFSSVGIFLYNIDTEEERYCGNFREEGWTELFSIPPASYQIRLRERVPELEA